MQILDLQPETKATANFGLNTKITIVSDDVAPIRHRKVSDRFSEVPSWLTSFVIHFLIFLTVISVAPLSKMPNGSNVVSLTMSVAGEETEASSILEVTIAQSMSDDGNSDSISAKVFQRMDELPRPTTQPQPMEPTEEAVDSSSDSSSEADGQPAELKYAALTMRHRFYSSKANGSGVAAARIRSNPIVQDQLDKIVDRFILYDVGELRGAEGTKALREFQALGPSALPALVRGLNKSANIHASCPVGVIASKLISTLRAAEDPSLTQYAIDNIGKGVSKHAPHFKRITTFRDEWLPKINDVPANISKMLSERGLEGDGAMFEISLSLTRASVAELMIAVESKDDDLSIPAMVAALKRIKSFSKADQFRLRSILLKKKAYATKDASKLVNECISLLDRLEQVRMRQRKSRR